MEWTAFCGNENRDHAACLKNTVNFILVSCLHNIVLLYYYLYKQNNYSNNWNHYMFSWQCFHYLFCCWQKHMYFKNTKDLHGNYCYTNAPQCYIVHTSPIYFFILLCTHIPWRCRHMFLQSCVAFYEITC
jgi:hypothetical protein